MRIYKTKVFDAWASKARIDDQMLKQAIDEIELQSYDARLGGYLYKQRIGRRGQGERGAYRTIIAFKKADTAFFLYGYAKNARANITFKEKEVYKKLAKILFSYNDKQIKHAIQFKELIEVTTDG